MFITRQLKYLFLLILLFFIITAVYRALNNDKTFLETASGFENDWNYYAKHALDIKNNGLLMPSVNENYLIPAGFLYNYFISACILLFGDYLEPIFVMQALMLFVTILLTYLYFKDEIDPELHILFVSGLFLFSLVDIYKHYTFLLLSENLAILFVMLFFYLLKKALSHHHLKHYLLSALFLGLTVLTRPTVYPFLIVLLIGLLLSVIVRKISTVSFIGFVTAGVLIIALLPLRNYFVTGNFKWLPTNGSFLEYMNLANPETIQNDTSAFFLYYVKKFLFCIGLLPLLEPLFQVRPHWLILWLGIVIYMIKYFRVSFSYHTYALLFIVMVMAVIVLIAPIQSYGFRMLLPFLFLLYGYGFLGFKSVINNLKTRFKL